MKVKIYLICNALSMVVLTGILVLSAVPAAAEEQERMQEQTQTRMQVEEQIYGGDLMTPDERAEYRIRMRAAKTYEERQRIREEHHEQMKERAGEQGITLPDEPPERGMGRGMGPGGGMGRGGGGMGQGGRNR